MKKTLIFFTLLSSPLNAQSERSADRCYEVYNERVSKNCGNTYNSSTPERYDRCVKHMAGLRQGCVDTVNSVNDQRKNREKNIKIRRMKEN